MNRIEKKLNDLYEEFVSNFGGMESNGLLKKDNSLKFSGHPFIGSKYGKDGSNKILFVGLDIGKDEKDNEFLDFEYKRKVCEFDGVKKYNPHFGGNYFCSLFFNKKLFDFEKFWKSLNESKTCLKILKEDELPKNNPISYVALTNFYKFVTKGRKKRKGSQDRKSKNSIELTNLLLKEIEILNPDIIIFQNKGFFSKNSLILPLLEKKVRVIIGPHTSGSGKVRYPYELIRLLREIKKVR